MRSSPEDRHGRIGLGTNHVLKIIWATAALLFEPANVVNQPDVDGELNTPHVHAAIDQAFGDLHP